MPQIDSHLTAKLYTDNAIDEESLVRVNEDIDFNSQNLTNIKSITLNKQAENDNEVIKHYRTISKYLLEMMFII